jgi:choline dehydrogenase-like flavoprotein
MCGKAAQWLEASGAVLTWPKSPGRGLSGGQHQAGTCRMGNDPKTSVVDRYCRVHDLDNLYVIDGSVHVTNGGFNPVLTIMAIAYYASDHLVRSHRRARA